MVKLPAFLPTKVLLDPPPGKLWINGIPFLMILPWPASVESTIEILQPTDRSHVSFILPVIIVAIIISLTESVPLTDSSTTDKFSTHKSVIQLTTLRFVITASVAERLSTVKSVTLDGT